jgi:hypothetical protein
MFILFGDTWSAHHANSPPVLLKEDAGGKFFEPPYSVERPFNADAVGKVPQNLTRDTVDDRPFALDFLTNTDGTYATLEVPGVNMLTEAVPTGAIAIGDGQALIFVTGKPWSQENFPQVQRSWIARWTDVSRALTETAHEFSRGPFANFPVPVIAGAGDVPGPTDIPEPVIWVWGTAFPNRGSSVRLGRARLGDVKADPSNRSAWEFFAGLTVTGAPRFADEGAAVPLFDCGSVGEISVSWNGYLERWLMLYNSPRPRGIICRSARDPWGPWDDGVVIFDPRKDRGYKHFMYDPKATGKGEAIHDPGRTGQTEWGGEYAPVVVPRFCKGSPGHSTIRYLMSTWNPYTVVLMESDVSTRESTVLTDPTGESRPSHG